MKSSISSDIANVLIDTVDKASTISGRKDFLTFHTVILAFEEVCEKLEISQKDQSRCYRILLRMTADDHIPWWKKVNNIQKYVGEHTFENIRRNKSVNKKTVSFSLSESKETDFTPIKSWTYNNPVNVDEEEVLNLAASLNGTPPLKYSISSENLGAESFVFLSPVSSNDIQNHDIIIDSDYSGSRPSSPEYSTDLRENYSPLTVDPVRNVICEETIEKVEKISSDKLVSKVVVIEQETSKQQLFSDNEVRDDDTQELSIKSAMRILYIFQEFMSKAAATDYKREFVANYFGWSSNRKSFNDISDKGVWPQASFGQNRKAVGANSELNPLRILFMWHSQLMDVKISSLKNTEVWMYTKVKEFAVMMLAHLIMRNWSKLANRKRISDTHYVMFLKRRGILGLLERVFLRKHRGSLQIRNSFTSCAMNTDMSFLNMTGERMSIGTSVDTTVLSHSTGYQRELQSNVLRGVRFHLAACVKSWYSRTVLRQRGKRVRLLEKSWRKKLIRTNFTAWKLLYEPIKLKYAQMDDFACRQASRFNAIKVKRCWKWFRTYHFNYAKEMQRIQVARKAIQASTLCIRAINCIVRPTVVKTFNALKYYASKHAPTSSHYKSADKHKQFHAKRTALFTWRILLKKREDMLMSTQLMLQKSLGITIEDDGIADNDMENLNAKDTGRKRHPILFRFPELLPSSRGASHRSLSMSRDIIVLMLNQMKMRKVLLKLKLNAIFPRMYFSPVDMICAALNVDTNSRETRKSSIMHREYGSVRFINEHTKRNQRALVNASLDRTIIHSTSHVLDIKKGVLEKLTSFGNCMCLATLPELSTSSPSFVPLRSMKLCIQSAEFIYNFICTKRQSYLMHLYDKHLNGEVVHESFVPRAGGKILILRNCALIKLSSAHVATARSFSLVIFRRFYRKLRMLVSLNRRSNSVKSMRYKRSYRLVLNIWKSAFAEVRGLKEIVLRNGFQKFAQYVSIKRQFGQRIESVARIWHLRKKWKTFLKEINLSRTIKRNNRTTFLNAMMYVQVSRRMTTNNSTDNVNSLLNFQGNNKLKKSFRRFDKSLISIKRNFPVDNDREELLLRLSYYVSTCSLRNQAARSIRRWKRKISLRLKIRENLLHLREMKKLTVLRWIYSYSKICLGYKKILRKRYSVVFKKWRDLYIQKRLLFFRIHRYFKSWRHRYIHNTAVKVWWRPIVERKEWAMTRWRNSVKRVKNIEVVVNEHVYVCRIQNIFQQWRLIMKAAQFCAKFRKYDLIHRLSRFSYWRKFERKTCKIAIFNRFLWKVYSHRTIRAFGRKMLSINCETFLNVPLRLKVFESKIKRMKNEKGKLFNASETKAKLLCRGHSFIRALRLIKANIEIIKENRMLCPVGIDHHKRFLIQNGFLKFLQCVRIAKSERLFICSRNLVKWCERTISIVRQKEMRLVSKRYYLHKLGKYACKIWLRFAKARINARRRILNAKRYHKKRIAGVALFLLRSK